MAERKVTGDDILLFIDPAGGTDYSLVICLTSQSITRSTNEIDARSKCGPDKQPGSKEIGISFEGQQMWDPGTDRISESDLHDLWNNQTTIGWKYGKETPVSDDVTYSGTGFISQLDNTANQDEVATFSGSIGVYGSITKTVTV